MHDEHSHRQDREHKKASHTAHPQGKRPNSVHPAWFVALGVILCGIGLFIWMFLLG